MKKSKVLVVVTLLVILIGGVLGSCKDKDYEVLKLSFEDGTPIEVYLYHNAFSKKLQKTFLFTEPTESYIKPIPTSDSEILFINSIKEEGDPKITKIREEYETLLKPYLTTGDYATAYCDPYYLRIYKGNNEKDIMSTIAKTKNTF